MKVKEHNLFSALALVPEQRQVYANHSEVAGGTICITLIPLRLFFSLGWLVTCRGLTVLGKQ